MTHKIIDDCIEAIKEAIESALEYDEQADEAVTTVDTNDGYIDLYCGDGNTATSFTTTIRNIAARRLKRLSPTQCPTLANTAINGLRTTRRTIGTTTASVTRPIISVGSTELKNISSTTINSNHYERNHSS